MAMDSHEAKSRKMDSRDEDEQGGANSKAPAEADVESTISEDITIDDDPSVTPAIEKPWDQGLEEEPWEKVVAGYESEAKALGKDKEAAPLWYEAGIIHEERLGNPRPAAICFQTAFKIDPTWRPNIHVARRLFTDVGNWAMVAQLLQAEADATDDTVEQAELLFERALLLHERLDKKSDAVALLARVDELAPNRLLVLKYLEGLAARTQDHERLADICMREAEVAGRGPTQVALLSVAGGLFAGRVGDSERAIEAYQKVLELEPGHPVALAALDHLLSLQGDHEGRLKVLEALARHSDDPKEAAAAWHEAARVADEHLGRRADAIGLLEEARQTVPDDPSILSELARRYEAAGTIEPLAEVLEKLAGITEDSRSLGEIHLRLGFILDDLGHGERAAEAYRKALEARPGDPAALAALGKLYFRSESWRDLIWTFEREMAATQDSKQRASRGFKIAEIQEMRLGEPEAAMKTLREILEEAPGYLPAVQALTRLYESSERWADMVSLLEVESAETEDVDQKVALLERVARVREERLEDPVSAAETWEKALALRPGHLPALRSLSRLYRKLERWEDLIKALEREADQVQDQRQVIALLHQVAELYDERLDDREEAIAAYRKVLGLQPNYLPALKALGRLCEQAQRWQELIDMFRMELEVTRSVDHVVSLLMKIGDIYERRLEDGEKAVGAYREVLDEKPDALVALRALERLHTRREEWESVVEILRQHSNIPESPLEKALLLTRAATIFESRVKDTEKACATYEEALQKMPDHVPALRALTRLHAASGKWETLAKTHERVLEHAESSAKTEIRRRLGLLYLERLGDTKAARACFEALLQTAQKDELALAALDIIYTSEGEHERAAKVRETMAELAGSDEASAALLHSTALAREHLIPGAEATDALWERLYELAPENPTVARHAELAARRTRDREKLLKIHERQLETAKGDDLRLAMAMRLGELASEDGHDLQTAEKAYRQALEVAPEYLPAIRGLKRTLATAGRWDEVQSLLEKEGEVSKDPERAVSLLFEAGVLREEHLEDAKAAERNYQKVLERDPNDHRAYERLSRLMEKQERHRELAEIHVWKAGLSQDPREKANAWLAAARIYAGPLEDPRTALSAVEEALRATSDDQHALELGAELAFSLEQWEKAAVLCQQRVELGGDAVALEPHRLRLAMLHHEQLGAPERAVAWLQDVLSESPSNLEALRRLTDIHVAAGNWAAAVGTMSKLAEAEADKTRRIPILLELSDLQVNRRNDAAAAVSTLEYVRVLDSQNIEAIKRLGKLHEKAQDWPAVVQTYEDFIEVTPAEQRERTYPLFIRLAELHAGPLGNPSKAIQAYRSALEIRPGEIGPRLALAKLLSRDPALQSLAIEEHKAALAHDPFQIDCYHALFDLYTATKSFEKAWVVAAILHFFKACTEEESFFYSDNKSRTPANPEGSLSAEDIATWLRHEDDSGPLADFVSIMGNQLARVHPPNLAQYHVGRSERLTPKDGSPLRRMCDSIAENIGGLDFELYRADRVPKALESFAADPPVIIIGPDFIRRHQVKEQRFLLARHLCRMALGTTLCVQLERDDVAAAIQASVQINVPEYKGLGVETTPDFSKKCSKSMARKARKVLEEPARRLAASEAQIDLDRFRTGVLRTSDRAGILLSADVETGLNILAAEAGKRDVDDRSESLKGVVPLEEALRFFLSDPYYRLRQRLKLSF